ncbi:MAG: hypothetical protein R8G33_00145 [Gammaproteobacteria bacterium]|nr:hypothetical protein [Gammaproteobacteria bacterium]
MNDLHVKDGVESKKPHQSTAYSNTSSKTYAHWIENQKFLLKNTALEYLGDAGDETTITLRRLNHPQRTPNNCGEYKTNIDNTSVGYTTKTRAAKSTAFSGKKKNAFRRLQ